MGLLRGSGGFFFFLSFPLIYTKNNWSKILRWGGGANMSILVVDGLDGMFFFFFEKSLLFLSWFEK